MNTKLLDYIENSFLKPILQDDGVTDVSYNGKSLFYLHNKDGRRKSDIKVTTTEVIDFVRQIANYSERQFSYTNPYLDVSIGKYRINAVHPSIVRVLNEKSCSFAIRIGSSDSRIINDYNFIDEKCRKYLMEAIANGKSLVIAGPTGSGKTELQKYLLMSMTKNTRIIVIDNVEELEYVQTNDDLDVTSWQISPNNTSTSIQELVRNALRSNPDWLVIAESRGKEMNEILNSVMTGHPIITTIHAENIEDIPNRISRMVEMADVTQKHESILTDVLDHLKIYVFLGRKFNTSGGVCRFVESIGEVQKNKDMKIIYRRNETCWL